MLRIWCALLIYTSSSLCDWCSFISTVQRCGKNKRTVVKNHCDYAWCDLSKKEGFTPPKILLPQSRVQWKLMWNSNRGGEMGAAGVISTAAQRFRKSRCFQWYQPSSDLPRQLNHRELKSEMSLVHPSPNRKCIQSFNQLPGSNGCKLPLKP